MLRNNDDDCDTLKTAPGNHLPDGVELETVNGGVCFNFGEIDPEGPGTHRLTHPVNWFKGNTKRLDYITEMPSL